MALIVGGTTVTGTQTLEASTLTGTASAINGSNITNLPAPSAANVGSATADLATDAVGTYGLLRQNNYTSRSPGTTQAGSSMWFTNCGNTQSDQPSGTWRLMGTMTSANATLNTTVCLRIS